MSKVGFWGITVLFLYEMRTFGFGENGKYHFGIVHYVLNITCAVLLETPHFHCLVIGLSVHIVCSFERKQSICPVCNAWFSLTMGLPLNIS